MAEVLNRNKINPKYLGVQGVKFKAEDDTVNFKGSAINFGEGDFSLEIYAKSEGSINSNTRIFGEGEHYSNNTIYIYPTNNSNGLNWFLLPKPLTDNLTKNSINVLYSTKSGLHHIVVTRKNQIVTVYINGKTTSSWTVTQDRILTFDALIPSIQCSQYFRHMRFFNYCLTQEEITELNNNGKPDKYAMSNKLRRKCIHEYLPNAVTETKWKDSIGTNHLIGTGAIELIYDTPYLEEEFNQGVPSELPKTIGIIYNDETNQTTYISTGINSLGDWKLI